MTLETTYGNLVSMAELARSNGIHVVLCSVLPAFDIPWRHGLEPSPKVIALNRMLKSYAEAHHLVYVDYYSSMVDDRGGLQQALTTDGVHPTLAGFRVMEPLATKGITQALASQQR